MSTMRLRERVLVADDDDGFRRVLIDQLGCTGWEIEEATDGNQALAFTAKNVPNLVLVDLSMRMSGGLNLLRALRQSVGVGSHVIS